MYCPDCLHAILIGEWPWPCHGTADHSLSRPLHANVHSSERCYVLENPKTKEIRVPGRADRPIHPKYTAAGFVKREMHPREVERRTGMVSEVMNYDRNSARADRDTGGT